MTERALYLLAFDLNKFSNASFHRQIDFWMTSIQDRVPGAKLLLVGTHADMIDEQEAEYRCDRIRSTIAVKVRRTTKQLDKKMAEFREKQKALKGKREAYALAKVQASAPEATMETAKKYVDLHDGGDALSPEQEQIAVKFKEFKDSKEALPVDDRLNEAALRDSIRRCDQQLKNLGQVPKQVFAVSSKSLLGIPTISNEIKRTVQDTRLFPELGEKIPTTWLKVRALIRAKRQEPKTYLLRTPDYLAMFAAELDMTEQEVDDATVFMHVSVLFLSAAALHLSLLRAK